MTKNDLRDEMKLTTRNGSTGIVVHNPFIISSGDMYLIWVNDTYILLTDYTDDLRHKHLNELDIVKIEIPAFKSYGRVEWNTVWERIKRGKYAEMHKGESWL